MENIKKALSYLEETTLKKTSEEVKDVQSCLKKATDELMGIEALICDMAMYRDDIENSTGRFKRVVDSLIDMLKESENKN